MMELNIKDTFKRLVEKDIKREGIKELMDWLETTDFYTAPASTRYHDSVPMGLVTHSVKTYWMLNDFNTDFDKETKAIVSLFHDLCKVNFYKTEMRNTKDERGNWIKVPYYTVDDQFPYGHGEKSVYILSQFMKLGDGEIMAIRWHMGGFAPVEERLTMSKAFENYPLAVYLHSADLMASYLK